ncbi:hypothetical protein R3W88_021971 [Solanum pinnatisectum]|uniref:Uncharacterized protein n=1 Tax=Solanum pinnatisectum TaxID=50273 RepID=A0AAV9LU73_9SOLN|nr:hypothetical protein R3W88_021971 [Solanum pinnatisectum]
MYLILSSLYKHYQIKFNQKLIDNTFHLWLIFFHREWSRNWPFLVGFAVTGAKKIQPKVDR